MVRDIPGLSGVDYLTNVSILELDTLPTHPVIVGGSYIALEFDRMYRRFGSRLTVVERGSRLASREDDVILGAGEVRITKSNNGFDLTTAPVAGSHLLLAVGRRPPISSTAILTRPRGA